MSAFYLLYWAGGCAESIPRGLRSYEPWGRELLKCAEHRELEQADLSTLTFTGAISEETPSLCPAPRRNEKMGLCCFKPQRL